MVLKLKLFVIVFCLVISGQSCKEKDKSAANSGNRAENKGSSSNGESSSSSAEKNFQFRLSPSVNKPYKYEMLNETVTEQEVNDTKASNESKIEMGVSYTVTKDTAGLFNFTMVYDKFKLHIKALDQEMNIDADNASQSFDPIEKIFGAFKNAAIQVQSDEKANVKKVTGFKELTDKMWTLAAGNPDALQMLNTTVKQYVAEENIKSSFEKTFKPLPDKLLKEGDTWVESQPVSSDLKTNIDNTYKVKSIEDGIATITISSDINMENQQAQVERTSVTTNLKGSQSGEIKMETATGMLLSSYTKLKLKGDILVMGRTVPLKMTISSSTKRVDK
jgi:Family of unknown function (DUF6263)